MNFPQDIFDIVLYYAGDRKLLPLVKNKKKLEFYDRINKAILHLEKHFIRYKMPLNMYEEGLYITNNNIIIRQYSNNINGQDIKKKITVIITKYQNNIPFAIYRPLYESLPVNFDYVHYFLCKYGCNNIGEHDLFFNKWSEVMNDIAKIKVTHIQF